METLKGTTQESSIEMKGRLCQEIVNKLQNEASQFLKKKLVLNGIAILPKEIEVYYYKEGEFEDKSVHQNELQTNKNMNHFYVHRWGKTQLDKYKGENRAGLDFVVSDGVNTYYSYLIRSAVINDGKPVVGPNKVLKTIKNACNFSSYNELEKNNVIIVANDISNDVLFSERINLGNNAEEHSHCALRAVLCDEYFKGSKYLKKEELIVNFLQNNSQKNALEYAKEKLGYIPSKIKNLNQL